MFTPDINVRDIVYPSGYFIVLDIEGFIKSGGKYYQ